MTASVSCLVQRDMKILITSTGSWGTGSFTVISALVKEYQRAGHHEVKVIFPDSGYPAPPPDSYLSNPDLWNIWQFPIEDNGIKLETFPLMITDPHPRNPLCRTFKDLTEEELQLYFDSFRARLQKVLEGFTPDIVECQHIWAMDRVVKELGLPYVCCAHHSDQMGFVYDERMRPGAIQSAIAAHYIFAVSDSVKQEIVEMYTGVQPEKIIVTGNGYDCEVFVKHTVDRQSVLHNLGIHDIPDDSVIVSFPGKLSRTKGIDILLRANSMMQGVQPEIHFIIFGAGNLEETLDKDRPREEYFTGIERVHFVGHRSSHELAACHNISLCSVVPSRAEGFGIACLESMGCRIPVVASKVGALPVFAVGRLIEPGDPQALMDAVLEIKDLSVDMYEELCEKSLSEARKWSWETIAKQRVEYYQKVIDKHTGTN